MIELEPRHVMTGLSFDRDSISICIPPKPFTSALGGAGFVVAELIDDDLTGHPFATVVSEGGYRYKYGNEFEKQPTQYFQTPATRISARVMGEVVFEDIISRSRLKPFYTRRVRKSQEALGKMLLSSLGRGQI